MLVVVSWVSDYVYVERLKGIFVVTKIVPFAGEFLAGPNRSSRSSDAGSDHVAHDDNSGKKGRDKKILIQCPHRFSTFIRVTHFSLSINSLSGLRH
jgi:hypothetical protein